MKKILLLIGLLSNFAFAANENIPDDRKIIEIKAYGDLIIIKFTPIYENSQECTSGSKDSVRLDVTDDQDKLMYSTILAAASAQKEIGFGIGGCSGQYPKVYRVDVKY